MAGLALVLASLLLYESWASRAVFGRWSYGYFVFLLCCVGAWVLCLDRTLRRFRRDGLHAAGSPGWMRFFGLAVLLWGLSRFLSALDSRANAGRILDGNLIGTTYPPSVVLDWFALVALAIALGMLAASKLPQRWHNVALGGGTLVVVLVLGEGIARITAIVDPETQGIPTYSEALWARRYATLNNAGYRDTEHAVQKAKDVRRLVVVGDSFAHGVGVTEIGERFGEQLAMRLSTGSGERWEAINAGQPDTHTLQHIQFLERMLEYRPDLVVLLYVFNDVDYLTPVTPRLGLLRKDGLLDRLHPVRLFFLNSYLFQGLFLRWRKIALGFGNKAQPPDPHADKALMTRHLDDLQRFVRKGRDAGASLLIVPFDNQVGASALQAARYARFVRDAEEYGLPICGIAGAFVGRDPGELRVNSFDGHPNALANRLAADATLRCLADARHGRAGERRPDELR